MCIFLIIKLKVTRWGDYPELPGRAQLCDHSQSYKRQAGGSKTEEYLCDQGSKRLSDAGKGTQVAPESHRDKK